MDACYRFTRKLREHGDLLASCIESVLGSLRVEMSGLGATVAIDGSDLPAYANGQRYVNNRTKLERTRYSDPDSTWGHRSAISTRAKGSYYGCKVHAAVDTATGLPVAWQVETASKNETLVVPDLLDRLAEGGIVPEHAIMDRGHDVTPRTTCVPTGASDRSSRCGRRRTSRPGSTCRVPASTAPEPSPGQT